MITDKFKAGTFGYINYKKKKLGIFSLCLAIVIAVIVLVGYFIFGTVKNLVSLPALLLVIPFANFGVNFIALFKYKSATPEQYSLVRNFEDAGMLLSDLVIVDEKGGRYYCEFAVVYGAGISAYSSYVLKDKYKPETHINELLKKRGLSSNFKIHNDFDEYLKHINKMSPCSDQERARLIKETIILSCM